jgi:G2/mitotic-specific cyclin 1/2
MRELESQSMPNPNYMHDQDDLDWKMRDILVDWLVEVHTRFQLLPETLFLTMNIVDRFLSAKVVRLERLQLVGITAIFIASKYEEVLSPHISNFQAMTRSQPDPEEEKAREKDQAHKSKNGQENDDQEDDGYSINKILEAERFILATLNYNLSYPNPMNFLRRVSKADNYDFRSRSLAKFLMEIGLVDHRFIQFKPSHVAAAAMYLSRLILDRGDWDEVLVFYSGYTEEELEPVVHLMVDYLARPIPTHEAFFKKYAHRKFLKG